MIQEAADASSGPPQISLDALGNRGIREINRQEGSEMPRKAYECSACNEIHDHEDQAEDCCRPEVNKVWLCDVCDEPHDDSECAEKCCAEKIKARHTETVRCPACYRDQELILHAVEIEIAGHCSECNPHYSIEHAFTIGDLVEQRITEKRT